MNGNIRKDFVDTFGQLTRKLSPWEVWKDFVVMCSCSFSNVFDKTHFDEREKLYMDTIKKYDKDEQMTFPKLLADVTMALEENPELAKQRFKHTGVFEYMTQDLNTFNGKYNAFHNDVEILYHWLYEYVLACLPDEKKVKY